jgi:hypothetical protein
MKKLILFAVALTIAACATTSGTGTGTPNDCLSPKPQFCSRP